MVRERIDLEKDERELTLKFRHPDHYTATMARRAYDAFIAMQDELGDWLDAKSMTKTAYVYGIGQG